MSKENEANEISISDWLREKEQHDKLKIELRKRICESFQDYAHFNFVIASAKHELRPCPFCGNKLVFLRDSYADIWVECPNCGCRGGQRDSRRMGFTGSVESAADAWNERADA